MDAADVVDLVPCPCMAPKRLEVEGLVRPAFCSAWGVCCDAAAGAKLKGCWEASAVDSLRLFWSSNVGRATP